MFRVPGRDLQYDTYENLVVDLLKTGADSTNVEIFTNNQWRPYKVPIVDEIGNAIPIDLIDEFVSLFGVPEQVLGSGAEGTVFKVKYKDQDKAVKIIPYDTNTNVSEVVAARLLHGSEHVIQTDVVITEKSSYLVMPVAVGSLGEFIRTRDLNPEDKKRHLFEIISGATEIWRKGCQHNDLFSHNVMMVPTSSGSVEAKITDFGLSDFSYPYEYTKNKDYYSIGLLALEIFTNGQYVEYDDPRDTVVNAVFPDLEDIERILLQDLIFKCLIGHREDLRVHPFFSGREGLANEPVLPLEVLNTESAPLDELGTNSRTEIHRFLETVKARNLNKEPIILQSLGCIELFASLSKEFVFSRPAVTLATLLLLSQQLTGKIVINQRDYIRNRQGLKIRDVERYSLFALPKLLESRILGQTALFPSAAHYVVAFREQGLVDKLVADAAICLIHDVYFQRPDLVKDRYKLAVAAVQLVQQSLKISDSSFGVADKSELVELFSGVAAVGSCLSGFVATRVEKYLAT